MIDSFWLNNLADVINNKYLIVIFLLVVLFSLPIFWLNHKRIKNSPLRDPYIYYLRHFIYWEFIIFAVVATVLLLKFPIL